jgi:hypothetical protein
VRALLEARAILGYPLANRHLGSGKPCSVSSLLGLKSDRDFFWLSDAACHIAHSRITSARRASRLISNARRLFERISMNNKVDIGTHLCYHAA